MVVSVSNSFKLEELRLLKKGLAVHRGALQGFTPEEKEALERLVGVVLRGGDVRDVIRSKRMRDALRKIPQLPVVEPTDAIVLESVESKLDKMLARVQTLTESGVVPRRKKPCDATENEDEIEEEPAADNAAAE